jgi:hypothetical protein
MTNTESLAVKIQSLLDKAAATSFPAEAEAFQEKAEQLMAKYGIEQAMLDQAAQKSGAGAEEIVVLHHRIKGTYAHGIISGLHAALAALRTVKTLTRDFGRSEKDLMIIGAKTDAEAALALVKSLEVQGLFAMKSFAKENKTRLGCYTPMEQFKEKRTFLTYFGYGVAERLRLRFKEAVTETTGAELVLVDRSKRVDDYISSQMSVRMVKDRTQHGGYTAANAGHAAGKSASLGDRNPKSTSQITR